MRNTHINDILYKHLSGKDFSPEEQAKFDQWLNESDANRFLLTQLSDEKEWQGYFSTRMDVENADRAFEKFITTRDQNAAVRTIPLRKYWGWAAAAIIVVVATGMYFLLSGDADPAAPVLVEKSTDIAPGKEGAILTLADGTTVVLDSLGNGVVAAQNGAQAKIRNGELVYDATDEPIEKISYNTLHTPKGRQFALTLADGTRVWLNAASSIRYPASFVGKERRVDITGEVYFEVAGTANVPFRVNVGGRAQIDVLGTNFNVNAYNNEPSINTTLIEGAVRVVAGEPNSLSVAKSVVLKPGQQAQVLLENQKNIHLVNGADIEKVMAWKNGLFNFDGASLEEVMKQLERWYDVEVVYEQGVPDKKLIGKMTKGVTLNGLIIGLKELGINARLEGRKLIVER